MRWKTHPDIIGLRVNMQAVAQHHGPTHPTASQVSAINEIAYDVIPNVLKTSISSIVVR